MGQCLVIGVCLVMDGSTLTIFISNLYGNFMTWEHLPDAQKSSLHWPPANVAVSRGNHHEWKSFDLVQTGSIYHRLGIISGWMLEIRVSCCICAPWSWVVGLIHEMQAQFAIKSSCLEPCESQASQASYGAWNCWGFLGTDLNSRMSVAALIQMQVKLQPCKQA
jgi:hypothetical protein